MRAAQVEHQQRAGAGQAKGGGEMADTELAQEMVREFLHLGRSLDVELYDQEIKRAKVIIARVRLDEAKWWANGEHTSKGALAMNPNQRCHRCERIAALEQAAGGSAAGSQK